MQTFKLIFKLFMSHKVPLLIIFGVFMGISVIMSGLNADDSAGEFSASKLQIGIVDEGDGTISNLIKNYYNEEHEIKEFPYNEKDIVNELYWKYIDYVLLIPEGADEQLVTKNGELELKCMKVPGNSANGLFETEIQMYLSKMQNLLSAGYTMEEAEKELLSLKDEKTKVIMANKVNENSHDRFTRYLMYIPYLFIAISIEGIGFILLIVNKKEVKDRVECSASSMRERTYGIVSAILLFGIFIFAIVYFVGAFLAKGSIFSDSRMPYFLINSVVLLLFALSLGFFVGVIAKSPVSLNGYQNIFALTLCFLGGVFVPQEVLGETALKVGRLLPTYWYVLSTEKISMMVHVTDSFKKEIFMNSFLIFCYAVAVFVLSLVIRTLKRKRVE